jgi:signal transduction histidine kinase/ActR/RegA family two-component response regulator
VRAALEAAIEQIGRLEKRYRMRAADGSERVLEIVARAVADAQGRTQSVVGTCRDVTQQVAHEQLLRDKESAERANRAKSQFLSRVSHELRTPLNGILGFTQLMALDRAHPLALDQQRRLDSVHRAGRHLLGLINDVLDLARIESEDFSVRLEAVDLSAALAVCLSLIVPLARDSRVLLPTPPAAPCWVQADRRGLDQVLMNLLSNAIQYNRAGGRVGATLHRDAGRVQVAISDEGAGLSAGQQARLFQHFDRLGAEGGRVEGTGLGLVISLELAHAMGAELSVRSEPGAGSTFTLALSAAAAPPADAASTATPPEPPATANRAPRRVLYIEDERLNVVLMQEVFRTRPEWALEIAEDGAEGVRMARALHPQLVLIDMNLPDTTGLALIRTLRADPATRALCCIALSADAMSEQIEAALAAGFDAYWTKPIDVPRMLRDLAQRLG